MFAVFLFIGMTADVGGDPIPEHRRCWCCLAPLSTLTFVDLSGSADEVGQAKVFLDFEQDLQAIKCSYRSNRTDNVIFTSRVVMDFKHGLSYEIFKEGDGGTVCYMRYLPLLAPLQCVPHFATLVTSDDRETVWRVDQPDDGLKLTYSFATDTCQLQNIRQTGSYQKISVDMDVRVTNYTTSIDDADVFHYPESCFLTLKPLRLPFPWSEYLSLSNHTSDQKESLYSTRHKKRFYAPALFGSWEKGRGCSHRLSGVIVFLCFLQYYLMTNLF